METCPYCMGEIRPEAVKCMHCGEWLDQRPHDRDDTLNQGVRFYVKYRIMTAAIGAVVFIAILLLFFLPMYERAQPQAPVPVTNVPVIQAPTCLASPSGC